MSRIAILGANGQVGSEVAFVLHSQKEANVIGLTRSEYGMILLRVAGVPCATADYSDIKSLRRILSDCDVVVDCTYPSGQVTDIRGLISLNMSAVMAAMRPGSRYIHLSSISAFGMPVDCLSVQNFRVPRTSYARIKRWAEHEAIKLARRHGIEAFIFRLGQVHGILQSVSHEFHEQIRAGKLRIAGAEESLATTVFTSAIAEAILRCEEGVLQPATVYTLVSNPQWTLGELVEYYQRVCTCDFQVSFEAGSPRVAYSVQAFKRLSVPTLRQFLEAHVFLRFPSLYTILKGRYRVRSVAVAMSSRNRNGGSLISCLTGVVPGMLVPSIQSSLELTLAAQSSLNKKFEELLSKARVG